MAITTVDISKTPTELSDLLSLSQEGVDIIITRGNTPIARLSAIAPAPADPTKRVGGLHAGSIWISDDFDAPLPDEFWLGEE